GHRIAVIDEEIPGLVATKQKLRWVTKESVAASDLIFTVGEEHNQALSQFFPRSANKSRVVGNPRWDLLRPELRSGHADEVAAIRAKYAPFILVNTNFGLTNSAKRTAKATRVWFVKTGRVDLNKREDIVFLDEIFEMERLNTESIRALLRELPVRFPKH